MTDPLDEIGITKADIESIEVTENDRRKMYSPSPLWGRYNKYTQALERITSEREWHRRRLGVEGEYLIALGDELHDYTGSKRKVIPRQFYEGEKKLIRSLSIEESDGGLYNDELFKLLEMTDGITHQDVVAMMRVGAYKLAELGFDSDMIQAAFHYALTSNDINSPVFASMVKDYLHDIYMPLMLDMENMFIQKAHLTGKDENPIGLVAGQTHGQYAVLTTWKKIFANFAVGLGKKLDEDFYESGPYKLEAKFGGPVGNNTGLATTYPNHNWTHFNRKFVESLGFDWDKMTDQDGFNHRNIKLFDAMIRVNDLLEKYASDFWDYCSRGIIVKTPTEKESGSSSMAQKVNPWRTEGGEIMLQWASNGLRMFHELGKYRRQGDLKRSMLRRMVGEPFGCIMVGVNRLMDDLSKYNPYPEQIQEELDRNPGMSAFYLQTLFKREGVGDAYDKIKKVTMGKNVTKDDLRDAIQGLVSDDLIESHIAEEAESHMNSPSAGDADKWADEALFDAEVIIGKISSAYDVKISEEK